MEYQALYRKHRPQRFDQMVGQEHVTQTLTREVVEGRIAHAYLFAGPRGTGKTTTARLLAKALNCPNRGDGAEPCNTCVSCVAITEGNSLDVIELDAASHNKVEDVREIRINVGTVAAAGGAKRIYILDEAHMLSRAAGNALLKTLEEPPDHVVFVLATTEPYKLLDTIRSRSQRFDFQPVATDVLVDHLTSVSAAEGIEATADALGVIAAHANGSVRDALSMLEQVAAFGDGVVGPETVGRTLGLADREAYGTLVGAIADGDAPTALGLVAELAGRGADLRRFAAEAVEYFRGIFLAQYAPNLDEIVDVSADTVAEWRRLADTISRPAVLRAVDVLGDALLQLRQGREERLVVELALLRVTRPETATDTAALAARLDRLETRVQSGTWRRGADGASAEAPVVTETVDQGAPQPTISAATPVAIPPPAFADGAGAETETAAAAPAEPTTASDGDLDLAQVEAVWPNLVARVREDAGPVRHSLLKVAVPQSVAKRTITVALPADQPFYYQRLSQDTDLTATVADIASTLLGVGVTVSWTTSDRPQRGPGDAETMPGHGELVDSSEGAIDASAIVADLLGGEVVSD
ncbi:MAG: DNA polymerase III subunit gamma/tau [Acidimicrobiia bacterium]|nr:DNA polymerase III subunit gamma/tau [Acidimicrobiia bacterium]